MNIVILNKILAAEYVDDNVSCISLISSCETPIENNCYNSILTIVVDDITPKTIKDMFEEEAWEDLNFLNIFDKGMLAKIIDYVKKLTCDTLVIHCSAGISRSSAVACLVQDYLGRDYDWILENPRYIPNKHICNFLPIKSNKMIKYLEERDYD